MNGGNRRQWYLLALLGVAVFAYFRFEGATMVSSSGGAGTLAPIDAEGLARALKGISTVSPLVMAGAKPDSVPDRNLFQYGERKPPPPPPMTESERKAAEMALQKQEEEARKALAAQQKAQEEQQKQQAQIQQQQQQAPPPPPRTPLPPPPPPPKVAPEFNLKLMGVLGPAKKKVGVFLDGDKMVLAREGDVLNGKFRIIDIGMEWAWIGYVDPDFKDQKKRVYFGL